MLELLCHTSVAKFFLWGGLCYRPISPRPVQNYRKQRQSLLGSLSLWCCPCLLPVLPFELKSIKEREIASRLPQGGKGPSVELPASRGNGPPEPEPRGGVGEEGPHASRVLGRQKELAGCMAPWLCLFGPFPGQSGGIPSYNYRASSTTFSAPRSCLYSLFFLTSQFSSGHYLRCQCRLHIGG